MFILPALLLLLIGDTYFVYKSYKIVFERELEETADSEFKLLKKTIFGSSDFLNQLTQKKTLLLLKDSNLYAEVIFSTEKLRKQLNEVQLRRLKKRQVLYSHDMSFLDNNNKHDSFFILYHKGLKKSYVLHLAQDIKRLNQILRQNLINGLIQALGLFVLFLVTAYYVGIKYIALPLEGIKNHLYLISEGNFSSRKILKANTEMYDISQLINLLASELRIYEANLLESYDEKINLLEKFRHQDRLKSVGQMAAGVAHEMGTPLNVVSGRASLIISDSKEESIISSAKIIKDESKRMTKIIQGMLDLSRKRKDLVTKCSVQNVVKSVIGFMNFDAKKQSITIKSEINSVSDLISIGEMAFQQVLINIIKNALHACSEKGEISICLMTPATLTQILLKNKKNAIDYIGLSINDNGKGICPKVQSSIFDPFFTTKDVGSGTGLGLSICHGIISEAGGFIEVDSTQNVGTVFYVILPKYNKGIDV